MGQFKPMVKMMTTEPSVILKLKKGGKVEKADGGFVPMQSTMPAGVPARGGLAAAASPARPSLAARRRAMNPNLLMKKGGKAEKHEDAAQDREMIKKAMAGKKFASGGKIDAAETKTTLKNSVKPFAKTKVVDGDKADKAHGTKGIKESNAGGYKSGGTIKGNVAKFENTKVVDGDKTDRAHGTKGVKMSNNAGYKKGGNVDWENRPADTSKPGVTGATTGGVRESNAGGYKKGGSAKKAYAAGGNVVDDGKAVKMPRHFVSRPVANSLQSGTFKKGGKVGKYAEGGREDEPALSARQLYAKTYAKHGKTIGQSKNAEAKAYEAVNKKHGDEVLKKLQAFHKKNENGYARGGKVDRKADGGLEDLSKGAYDRAVSEKPMGSSFASKVQSGIDKLFGAKPAGSVTKTKESVTVSPGKKRGGKVC